MLPPYAGLGLYGGIIGAAVGIWVFLRGKGIPLARALDVVVPGTLFAQGIARWGNFFNQELYGPPTDLPWGIAIDCGHRIAQYPCTLYPVETTGFHPLFFYESALTITGGVIALVLARRFTSRLLDGDLASFWMIWYGGVRLAPRVLSRWLELDAAGHPGGHAHRCRAHRVGHRHHRVAPPATAGRSRSDTVDRGASGSLVSLRSARPG